MKRLCLITLIFLAITAKSQDSCQVALQVKSFPIQTFILSDSFPSQIGTINGCLFNIKAPYWFYGKVTYPGDIALKFESLQAKDIDMAAWGPFIDPVSPCVSQLTNSNIIDCDYNTSSAFEVNISNALSGQYYIILLSQFQYNASSPDTIQVGQTNIGQANYGLFGNDSISCMWTNVYFHQDICYITNDSTTNKNKLVWDASQNPLFGPIDYFIIKKENTSMIYDSIGFVNQNSTSSFIDNTSDPSVQSVYYKISFKDTCGNKSSLSPFHKTIHLAANIGATQNQVNLIWNQYEGYSYTTHYIFRSISSGVFTIIDSVSYNITSYTDINANGSNIKYKIGIKAPLVCPTNKTSYNYVFSNSSNYLNNANIVLEDIIANSFPNPFNDFTKITFNKFQVSKNFSIKDITGKTVKEFKNFSGNEFILNRENLKSGIYLFEGESMKPVRLILL